MSGAWAPDPWGRYGYRWYTEQGWTEHVSDGTARFVDLPGDRPSAPSREPALVGGVPEARPQTQADQPGMVTGVPTTANGVSHTITGTDEIWRPATGLNGVNGAAVGATVTAPPQPIATQTQLPPQMRTQTDTQARPQQRPAQPRPEASQPPRAATPAAPTRSAAAPPPRRWPLVAVGMVASFALGGFVFGRAGGDETVAPIDEAAATSVVSTTVAAPTTVPETVPPETVPPSTTPPITVANPFPMSEEDFAARNDLAIDDFEWAILNEQAAQLGWVLPAREEVTAIGTSFCELVANAPTMLDIENGLDQAVAASTLPAGQYAVMAGMTSGAMCLEVVTRTGLVPTVDPTAPNPAAEPAADPAAASTVPVEPTAAASTVPAAGA
ncbi:MAG: hypothetical protein KDB40_13710 [Acidimicrobiales bacterium]|nr:hypothetical protein [Acidimicrobiales bacterium]MCB9392263.1 hypothetical protein [Acidimicrobiaceae bacterium]